jgi:hypothetical protein
MVMMVIKRVSMEKCLCQDPSSQSSMFENLPARDAWVCGYAPLCPASNSAAPQKPGGCGTCQALKGPQVAGRYVWGEGPV